MTKNFIVALLCAIIFFTGCELWEKAAQESDAWISLFDGKTLDGWKVSEKPGTFTVDDSMIVVHGPRSHLFYVGPVQNANFKNFEFKADVLTKPGANSGLYFHTEYIDDWPAKGYEAQVNNRHTDWRRTGSLYGVVDIKENLAKDNEWFTQRIIVKDKHITILVNDKVAVDYTEPDGISQTGFPGKPGQKLSSGTFAIQGHDPASEVHYKNIRVKPLP